MKKIMKVTLFFCYISLFFKEPEAQFTNSHSRAFSGLQFVAAFLVFSKICQ